MAAKTTDDGVFRAPMNIEYPFSRTTGPEIGACLTGVLVRVLIGSSAAVGRGLMPTTKDDPSTGDEISEREEVGPGGVVDTWAWSRTPLTKHPPAHPFTWALVRPDGGD